MSKLISTERKRDGLLVHVLKDSIGRRYSYGHHDIIFCRHCRKSKHDEPKKVCDKKHEKRTSREQVELEVLATKIKEGLKSGK